MKPNKETMDAYKTMAAQSPDSMKAKIKAHLETNCPKFAGNEERLDDCLEYLNECAREILNSKSGEVADEVCYRICRDYFDDELWKEEETAKAEEAKPVKAESAIEALVTKDEPMKPEPGQLDFFTAMGC